MKKLKETLNLPSTGFSMKANLAQKEPEILNFWEEMDLYSKILERNKINQNLFCMMGLLTQTDRYIWGMW